MRLRPQALSHVCSPAWCAQDRFSLRFVPAQQFCLLLLRGWDVAPIDQASCRFHLRAPLVVLDLREPQSLDILLSFDEASPADWFYVGLPCGTCSRARERPLPGRDGARPLRGPDALFGLPNLRPFESEQVAAANAVYKACVRVLFRAYQTGALLTVENPVRSWLWPLLASLVKQFGHKAFAEWYFALQDYDFDACMFGSRWAKATRIKGTPLVFDGLQLSLSDQRRSRVRPAAL